jgi:hypothetical protein
LCCEAQVSVEIFTTMVDGGARLPLSSARQLIGNETDPMSLTKLGCLARAIELDRQRPVISRYFLS